ncbi:hypothetical protein AALP_AAs67435U000300 [Arabis alpina]|uniref:Uncharacterized protein n=1 Tax=Arabis alpina TaxID=50452 RepID=A0A087FZK6_ARAAL|nr:hypothetical protein AALP_AAs67435U000300 [Arabis alpina]
MSSASSFEHFLENVLKPMTTFLDNVGQSAEKACPDAASSSWLRPCSKQRDETQALDAHNTEGPKNPSLVDEPINDIPICVDELADDVPVLVDVKAEMEEFDHPVEQRKLDRLAGSQRRAPRRSRKKSRFLAFVNRVGHELEAEIEKQKLSADDYAKGELAAKTERNKYAEHLDKRNNELERAFGDNKRLRVENEKLAKKLEAAKKDASNSLTFLTRRNEQVDELKRQVGQKRELLKTAKALIVDLHEKFAIAKAKFVELKGDPQDKMAFQIQREANLDFVKQLLGLFPDRKAPRLEDELASLTADVEANVGDEEYFDKLMESLGECLDVVLLEFVKPTLPNQDVSLEKLAVDTGVVDVSGSIMSLENAGGLLQEMRIDSAGLLKNLMISEDGRMSFAGDDKAEVTTIAAEDIEAEKTRIGGDATEIEKTVADEDRAEKAVSEKAGLTTLVTSSEAAKDEEAHP